MQTIREIIMSPWFYISFVIIAITSFAFSVSGGGGIAYAFLVALVNGFFWGLAISGAARLFTRFRY